MRGKGRYHELLELSKRELVKKVVGLEQAAKLSNGTIKIRNKRIKTLEEVLRELGYELI